MQAHSGLDGRFSGSGSLRGQSGGEQQVDAMIKKLLTRVLILVTVLVLTYFALLSRDVESVRFEKSPQEAIENGVQGQGTDGSYRQYDSQGNVITWGKASRATRVEDAHFILEQPRIRHIVNGRTFFIQADSLKTGADNTRTMEAEPGSRIELIEEGGIEIRTPGPMVQTADGLVETKTEAEFKMGNAQGHCKGLRYLSGSYLEMLGQVVFTQTAETSTIIIEADYLKLDQTGQTGTIRGGRMISRSLQGESAFAARDIDISFKALAVGRFSMDRARLKGSPARFIWEDGDLASTEFDICFDQSGRLARQLDTANDARFSSRTQDGYLLEGGGSSLNLEMDEGAPQLLTSRESIVIEGVKNDGLSLSLTGDEGVRTEFSNGKAASTRIFGSPHFHFGTQTGNAGNLRVLHKEHQILFSDGAQLTDSEENVHIKGDQILLANWDLQKKEIFAFRFVDIVFHPNTPEEIRSIGDVLELRLPGNDLKIEGNPARVVREGQTIQAKTIEITQIDSEVFNMKTGEQVVLDLVNQTGTFLIEAKTMSYQGKTRTLRFDHVLRAVTPDGGELVCGHLEVVLKRGFGKDAVTSLVGTQDVVFKHFIMRDGQRKPITCAADRLAHDFEKQVVTISGVGRDAIFSSPEGEVRSRELIYNLKDGSLKADPEKGGTTRTRVPLKDPAGRERN